MPLNEGFNPECVQDCVLARHINFTDILCSVREAIPNATLRHVKSARQADEAEQVAAQPPDHSSLVQAYVADEISYEEMAEEAAARDQFHIEAQNILKKTLEEVDKIFDLTIPDAAEINKQEEDAERELAKIEQVRMITAKFAQQIADSQCLGPDMSVDQTDEEFDAYCQVSQTSDFNPMNFWPKNCTQQAIFSRYMKAYNLKMLDLNTPSED